jgi:lipoate-protein ligase A
VKGSAACYLHSTAADLSLDGKKLSGSAQVWLHDTVLQHGSLVITRDVSREAAVFGLERLEAERLAESTVTLSDELAEPPSVEALVEAVVDGFARTLGVTLEPAGLTDAEREFAETLHDEVHAPFG